MLTNIGKGDFVVPLEKPGEVRVVVEDCGDGFYKTLGIDWYSVYVGGKEIAGSLCQDDVSWYTADDLMRPRTR